jgi:hypothetical protein
MNDDDNSEPQAYPLQWPIGRPRARHRTAAAFRKGGRRLEVADGVRRVLAELRRFGARSVAISTNIRPTLAGSLNRETPTNGDPGVAVYFRLGDQPHCVSCDRWDRVADNLAAVAADVEAQRGRLRWGCVDVLAAFAGQKLLPAAERRTPWWEILGFHDPPGSKAEIDSAERRALLISHPDRNPGDQAAANRAAEITQAAHEGRRVIELQGALAQP